jgi:Mn2+/Fe2+ NRAMP family transporter
LAAGLSATTSAGMAGQIVLEGFLEIRLPLAMG